MPSSSEPCVGIVAIAVVRTIVNKVEVIPVVIRGRVQDLHILYVRDGFWSY
jgi:hypothetical protein